MRHITKKENINHQILLCRVMKIKAINQKDTQNPNIHTKKKSPCTFYGAKAIFIPLKLKTKNLKPI